MNYQLLKTIHWGLTTQPLKRLGYAVLGGAFFLFGGLTLKSPESADIFQAMIFFIIGFSLLIPALMSKKNTIEVYCDKLVLNETEELLYENIVSFIIHKDYIQKVRMYLKINYQVNGVVHTTDQIIIKLFEDEADYNFLKETLITNTQLKLNESSFKSTSVYLNEEYY